MVLGGEKCFQYKDQIEETYIFSKDKVVLLGITVDNKLTFEAHIENLNPHKKKHHTSYGPCRE